MSEITLRVDTELLKELKEEMGTDSEEETVTAVLLERADRFRRRRALRRLQEMAADGDFDVDLLMDKENYRR